MALLNERIDIAVHSMKDVPVQLPKGIVKAAVMKRGSYKDLLIVSGEWGVVSKELTIATSSIRRKAQWLHRYPHHTIVSLRGNVNTRLRKLEESNWNGAIFAAAGLERINLRPENSMELDWMLPAPAQGAILVVCRETDQMVKEACTLFNDEATALCTHIERDFLRTLLGGCSTPISAFAEIINDQVHFKGNILSVDGARIVEIEKQEAKADAEDMGRQAANELLLKGGQFIADSFRSQNKA
jgi:hydroxymethylbilane synthase